MTEGYWQNYYPPYTTTTAPYPGTTYIGDPPPLVTWTPPKQRHTEPGTDSAFCPACIEQVEKEGSCTCRLGGSEHVGDSGAEHVTIAGDSPAASNTPRKQYEDGFISLEEAYKLTDTGPSPTEATIPEYIEFGYPEPYCPEAWTVRAEGIWPICERDHVHNPISGNTQADFLRAIYEASYGQR